MKRQKRIIVKFLAAVILGLLWGVLIAILPNNAECREGKGKKTPSPKAKSNKDLKVALTSTVDFYRGKQYVTEIQYGVSNQSNTPYYGIRVWIHFYYDCSAPHVCSGGDDAYYESKEVKPGSPIFVNIPFFGSPSVQEVKFVKVEGYRGSLKLNSRDGRLKEGTKVKVSKPALILNPRDPSIHPRLRKFYENPYGTIEMIMLEQSKSKGKAKEWVWVQFPSSNNQGMWIESKYVSVAEE